MQMLNEVRQDVNDIDQLISQKLLVNKNSILTFTDRVEFLTDLFSSKDNEYDEFISIGHVTPEIAMAADRAGYEVTEQLNRNPFSNTGNLLTQRPSNSKVILYIANPNRVTGGTIAVKTLREAIEQYARGLVIIDEYYFDYFGITALPLLDVFTNVVVLRSFTSAFGINSSDAGFAVTSPRILDPLRSAHSCKAISKYLRRSILAGMSSDDALAYRMKEIHDESLRLSKTLTKLGIMCRITSTDALLIRVKSPKDVGNELAREKVMIENLDGYPNLQGYLSYRIESLQSNEKLINAFKRMPKHYYLMPEVIPSKLTLHRSAERDHSQRTERPAVKQTSAGNEKTDTNRVKTNKHIFKLG